MSGLFTVALKTPYDENENGLSFSGQLIPATPEEIKAAHGKCGTCRYILFDSYDDRFVCKSLFGLCDVNPDTDYCNHHEPKET